jgi:hypothetical protein
VGLPGERLIQGGVDGIEEVSSDFVEALGAPLGYLDQVIDKDIGSS